MGAAVHHCGPRYRRRRRSAAHLRRDPAGRRHLHGADGAAARRGQTEGESGLGSRLGSGAVGSRAGRAGQCRASKEHAWALEQVATVSAARQPPTIALLHSLSRSLAPQWGALSNIVSYWLLAIPLAHHLAFARDWGLPGLWVGAATANTFQARASAGLQAVLRQAGGHSPPC